MQGYSIARPMPSEQIVTWVRTFNLTSFCHDVVVFYFQEATISQVVMFAVIPKLRRVGFW